MLADEEEQGICHENFYYLRRGEVLCEIQRCPSIQMSLDIVHILALEFLQWRFELNENAKSATMPF